MAVLSFCVFFLALGTPTTLLVAYTTTDLVAASILEGLSLTQSVYYCEQSTTVRPAVERIFAAQSTSFDSSLFHPPIS
jgi:hypothetical protein